MPLFQADTIFPLTFYHQPASSLCFSRNPLLGVSHLYGLSPGMGVEACSCPGGLSLAPHETPSPPWGHYDLISAHTYFLLFQSRHSGLLN